MNSTSALRAVLCGIALCFVCGCGQATEVGQVRQALADLQRGYAERDPKAVCRKLFSSVFLPPELARRLRLPWGQPGTPTLWDKDYRECASSFGSHGEFGPPWLVDVVVTDVSAGPRFHPIGGISRIVRAGIVREGTSESGTTWFIRFEGDWKMIFQSD